jgi:hypothetical protein
MPQGRFITPFKGNKVLFLANTKAAITISIRQHAVNLTAVSTHPGFAVVVSYRAKRRDVEGIYALARRRREADVQS